MHKILIALSLTAVTACTVADAKANITQMCVTYPDVMIAGLPERTRDDVRRVRADVRLPQENDLVGAVSRTSRRSTMSTGTVATSASIDNFTDSRSSAPACSCARDDSTLRRTRPQRSTSYVRSSGTLKSL